jgi:hypothetical protein
MHPGLASPAQRQTCSTPARVGVRMAHGMDVRPSLVDLTVDEESRCVGGSRAVPADDKARLEGEADEGASRHESEVDP